MYIQIYKTLSILFLIIKLVTNITIVTWLNFFLTYKASKNIYIPSSVMHLTSLKQSINVS